MTLKKFHFHFVPTGTGVISGAEVLQQTEDAINDIGDYADNASDNSQEALAIAQEARATAQTANSTSSNALAEANSATEKVETLKQVVDDWDADIQTSISNSRSALDASSQAVSTANASLNSANQAKASAQTSAASAQTAQNNSEQAKQSAQTAQQNAQDASNSAQSAQTLAQTAQRNAQTAQEIAQDASASAYAVRTINKALSISETINTADLRPQGNIKVGDTVVGTDGRMFRIASVNTGAGTAILSADWVDLTPNLSYTTNQNLTAEQQKTARDNLAFQTGVDDWATENFNSRVDDYLVPIIEELILENGGTQEEIDNIINGTA